MNWELEHNGKRASLSDWGLSQLKRTCINQGRDRVTFEESQSVDLQALFKPESIVTLYRDGAPWFSGIITKVPGYASAKREAHIYEVSGPWWYLETLVFQQQWKQVVKVSKKSSKPEYAHIPTGRVILGQNIDGNAMTNGEQIREIVQYAIDQGAPIAIGEIEPDTEFPYDETKDISCADAIKRLLRWTPDAVVHFDYTQRIPVMHVRKRKSLPVTTLDIKDNISRLQITPRQDLVLPEVVVKYEKQHNQNGVHWTSTEVDAFPKHATGNAFKALVLTVELDGMRSQVIQQPIRTRTMEVKSVHWWTEHLPFLRNVSDIRIQKVSRNTDLPNELTEGTVSKWMHKEATEDVVSAKISYRTPHEHVIDREVAIKVHVTDAQTHVYQKMNTRNVAESAPVGLAKALHESVSVLHYDGSVIIQSEEVGCDGYLGRSLCIKNSNTEWITMNAVIQRTEEHVDTGTTRIAFGPPKHLGVDDMVELLRVNRRRRATRNASRRIRGTNSSNVIESGTHSRIENTDTGGKRYSKLVLQNDKNPKCRLVLDTDEIHKELDVTFTEEYVCENGELKKRIVLASPAYEES